jgi:lysozyme family protein
MDFDAAFRRLLGSEGGYVNHPNDPGGETMWGVTLTVARQYGYAGAMKDLPVDLAKKIYRAGYWDSVKADELPDAVRYAVFDAAVNSGTGQASRWLQRALGVADDGKIGPMTIAAARAANPEALLRKMLAQRLKFMTDLSTWPSFSRGWARRIVSLMGA